MTCTVLSVHLRMFVWHPGPYIERSARLHSRLGGNAGVAIVVETYYKHHTSQSKIMSSDGTSLRSEIVDEEALTPAPFKDDE